MVCVSSRADLEKKAGLAPGSIKDLHREFVDEITIPDPRGDKFPPLHRIDPVFDCWFESGSMPYA